MKNRNISFEYHKKYLPKFSYPQKSLNRKFWTQKNLSIRGGGLPSIIPVTLNPEYLTLGVLQHSATAVF